MNLSYTRIERASRSPKDTSHHVYGVPLTNWFASPESWSSQTKGSQADGNRRKPVLLGFKNPWPSWHKPTRQELWNAFEWGDDKDPCIQLAAKHSKTYRREKMPGAAAEIASELLTTIKPDFKFDAKEEKCKVTWLGHAGVLVQLKPQENGSRPFTCLFDPLFSMRCSPSQYAGPLRSYPPPCKVEELPEIDIVMISHDHYDHLDYDSIISLWEHNRDTIRFVVPLGNAAWFASCDIAQDRVVELDWWDSVSLSDSPDSPEVVIKITCTPSQHNSGRGGAKPNTTLWSSWYVEHRLPEPFRVFFAGDTGFQFHDSMDWPPSPNYTGKPQIDVRLSDVNGVWSTCPAFRDIAQALGCPHVLLLPIAVGATYDYLRSFVPLPNSFNLFPRHRPGVTAANHMPPWDAVRVFHEMTKDFDFTRGNSPLAVAMHWGTFVSDPVDILKTLGQLEFACEQHDTKFARSLAGQWSPTQRQFLALNHGQSIAL